MKKNNKIIGIWLVVLSFLFLGITKIYEVGQGHQVFIENLKIGELVSLGDVHYSIDGGKVLKIKKNKKSKISVQGKNHIINFSYKNEENEKISVERKFIIKKNSNAIISIGKLVYKVDTDWITYKGMYD